MKITKSRKRILDFFAENEGAYSASEVHEKLKDFDLATIYRNLNLFVKEELIKELRLNKGESTYEMNHDQHDHALCKKCGEVRHIKIDKEKIKHLIKIDGFEIEEVEILLKGRCTTVQPSRN